MTEIDFEKIGLKVGLEIHQQLNTNKKLFCKCRPIESDEYTEKFSRSLRTAKSELGELDPAALFEKTKSKKTGKKSAKKQAKKSADSTDDSGIVLIDDDFTVDTEKELEERRAFLEEARSQDTTD